MGSKEQRIRELEIETPAGVGRREFLVSQFELSV